MDASMTTPAIGDWVIDTRWAVYGADLRKVGAVVDIQPEYLVVRTGLVIRHTRYIPVSTITYVERESVYLNVSSSDIDARGWSRLSVAAEQTGAPPSGQPAPVSDIAAGQLAVT